MVAILTSEEYPSRSATMRMDDAAVLDERGKAWSISGFSELGGDSDRPIAERFNAACIDDLFPGGDAIDC